MLWTSRCRTCVAPFEFTGDLTKSSTRQATQIHPWKVKQWEHVEYNEIIWILESETHFEIESEVLCTFGYNIVFFCQF